MSEYNHEWENDWARYVVYYASGRVRESMLKPNIMGLADAKYTYLMDVGPQEEETIIQRYTDQQMELEAQGWTLWSAGDKRPAVESGVFIDMEFYTNSQRKLCCCTTDSSWGILSEVMAYRLHNKEGYENGVKIEDAVNPVLDFAEKILHGEPKHREWLTSAAEAYVNGVALPDVDAKSEWVEWLPPVGEACEWRGNSGGYWIKGVIISFSEAEAVILNDADGKYRAGRFEIMPLVCIKFRPLKTTKQKVIDKALALDTDLYSSRIEFCGMLYDLGMLIDNDNGGE